MKCNDHPLSSRAHSPAERLKSFAELLRPKVGAIDVIQYGKLIVRNNRFAHNIIGLFFYGEEGGHRFFDNRFENNLTQLAVTAPGVAKPVAVRYAWKPDPEASLFNGAGLPATPFRTDGQ